MQLIDIDLISKGRYTWPHERLSEESKRQAQLSGIAEAVKVKSTAPGQYEIIGDPTAWFLAQAIQAHQVPCINLDHLKEDELEELARPASTTPGIIELAEKVASSLPNYKSKAAYGRAHDMSRALVCNLVRIHAISADIKDRIRAHPDRVTLGHAKVIAGLPHTQQNQLLSEIVNSRLSVHAAEERGRRMKLGEGGAPASKPAEVKRLEQEISELIGCETCIDMEQGRVVIDYRKDIDVLDGVLERLGYQQ